MAKIDPRVVLDELRNLDFIWVGSPIRRWFMGRIVGWNVTSSSIIRKSYTLYRLKKEIEENQLPLEVRDWPEHSNSFQVFLKEAV